MGIYSMVCEPSAGTETRARIQIESGGSSMWIFALCCALWEWSSKYIIYRIFLNPRMSENVNSWVTEKKTLFYFHVSLIFSYQFFKNFFRAFKVLFLIFLTDKFILGRFLDFFAIESTKTRKSSELGLIVARFLKKSDCIRNIGQYTSIQLQKLNWLMWLIMILFRCSHGVPMKEDSLVVVE